MIKIRVFLKNGKSLRERMDSYFKEGSKLKLIGGQPLYCWEFERATLEPEHYFYTTSKNSYRLFVNHDGFWIGRLFTTVPNKETNKFERHWVSVEGELGVVKVETLKGDFWFK